MRSVSEIVGLFVVSLLAAVHTLAVPLDPEDYPTDMGNVQQGCSGATHCIIYASGGSSVTTEDIRSDLRTLTAGMPPGVGIRAHRPTGGDPGARFYSESDINSLRADAGALSPQFGSRMATVGVSEGVRAIRFALDSYGQQVGTWIEIDQFSPFLIPPLDTTRIYQAVASYSANWPSDIQVLFNTGPSNFGNQFPYYSIITNPGSLFNLVDPHTTAIRLGLSAANGALVPAMSDDLPSLHIALHLQHDGQWVESPTDSGDPSVTSPPQGGGPGAPSSGGGLGIESFPAWLKPRKVPHVQ